MFNSLPGIVFQRDGITSVAMPWNSIVHAEMIELAIERSSSIAFGSG
jgi:hypothetical protein